VETATTNAPPRYRIEHRRPGWRPMAMGHADTLAAAIVELAAVRPWLRAAGEDGRLVVVDEHEATGRVVAACRVGEGA
jgi:hypothetical protein